jgi:hypothetical protein
MWLHSLREYRSFGKVFVFEAHFSLMLSIGSFKKKAIWQFLAQKKECLKEFKSSPFPR